MPFHPPYEPDGSDGYTCPRKHHSDHPIKQSRTTCIYKLSIPSEIGYFQVEVFEQCGHQYLIVPPVAQQTPLVQQRKRPVRETAYRIERM